jgi:hypothetical protein
MNKKYQAIIEAVERFRALSRLHIEKMFFSYTKNSKNNCNTVLKKLVDRGYLSVNKSYSPYVYFLADTKIKKQGQKISQYLNIADTFLSMQKFGSLSYFDVEPRFKLGGVEVRPDLYCRWKGNIWAVECQNSRFSTKQIEDKIKQYEKLFISGQYKELPFQTDKKVMPLVLIIGEGVPYSVQSNHIRILQVKSINELMERSKVTQPNRSEGCEGVKIKIG